MDLSSRKIYKYSSVHLSLNARHSKSTFFCSHVIHGYSSYQVKYPKFIGLKFGFIDKYVGHVIYYISFVLCGQD